MAVLTALAAGPDDDTPRRLYADPGLPDRIFRAVLRSGGTFVLAVMLLVGGFLLYRAWLALDKAGWSFLTTAQWAPDQGNFGIAAVLVGTVARSLAVRPRAVASRPPASTGATSPSSPAWDRTRGSVTWCVTEPRARAERGRRPAGEHATAALPVNRPTPAESGPLHPTAQIPAAADRSRLIVASVSAACARAAGRSACAATGTTTSR